MLVIRADIVKLAKTKLGVINSIIKKIIVRMSQSRNDILDFF